MILFKPLANGHIELSVYFMGSVCLIGEYATLQAAERAAAEWLKEKVMNNEQDN